MCRKPSPTMTIRSMCWCTRRFPCCRVWWCAAARSESCAWTMNPAAMPNCWQSPRTKSVRCEHWKSIADVPDIRLRQIKHFFEHYKDLEAAKWVKVIGWAGVDVAHAEILNGIKRYEAEKRVQS